MIEPIISSNFFILTGGHGSGKTTVLDELAKRGYLIVPEVARVIIKELLAIDYCKKGYRVVIGSLVEFKS